MFQLSKALFVGVAVGLGVVLYQYLGV